METLLLVLHVTAALAIIGLVLLQHGKGADMGAAFGGGASGSVFGATGSANFLSRATAVLATVFFLTSMALTWFYAHKGNAKGIMAAPPVTQQAPATTPATQIPAPSPDKPAGGADSKTKDIPK
ncbi:MAG: preprotein translocase subunit SecG [Burkholderiales bacterium]